MPENQKKPFKVGELILFIIIETSIVSAALKFFDIKENLLNFLIFFVLIPLVTVTVYMKLRYPKP